MGKVQEIIIVLFMFINFSLFGTRGLSLFGCEKGGPAKIKKNEELGVLLSFSVNLDNWKSIRNNIAHKILLGANPNIIGKNGKTALHEAVVLEDYDFIDFLLCHGANPNINNNQGQAPIFTVSSCCFAKLLFANGACARVVDDSGYTLLHSAMHGEPALLSLYLEKLAQENYDNASEQISIKDFFIGKERTRPGSFFHTLLLFQITPNTKNVYGEAPLHILAQKAFYFIKHCEQENCYLKVQTLLRAGALLNLEDNCGRTPYDIALECIRKEFQSESFPDAQRFLSLFEQKKKVSFFGQLKRFALCY